MRKISLLAGIFLLLVSCAEPSVVGSWVQPVPGMENQIQGIKLEKGGKASSINMHTLVYQSWKQEGNKLILGGESIGNGQTIQFSEDFEIVFSDKDTLVLKRDGVELTYNRQRE